MIFNEFIKLRVTVFAVTLIAITMVAIGCTTSNSDEITNSTPSPTPNPTSSATPPTTSNPTPSNETPMPTSVTWIKDWDEALKLAQEKSKPLMVNFYTNVCPYCVKLDKNVFQNPETELFIAQNFVTVKSNASTSRLHANFGLSSSGRISVPVTIFAMSDGTEFARIPGYASVDRFQPWLEQILEVWNEKSED